MRVRCRLVVLGVLCAGGAAMAAEPVEEGDPIGRLKRGAASYEAGDYAAAQQELGAAATARALKNRDLALYLLASSEALDTPPRRAEALAHFEMVAAMQQSPWRTLARARGADLLYELDRVEEARAAYRAVAGTSAPEIDLVVVRFRLAELDARAGEARFALPALKRLVAEHPAHPLAARAEERLRALDPAWEVTPADHVERAKRLIADRAWAQAIEELGRLPSSISQALRDEADYQIGMAHFRMRRRYDVAAEKLLGVWPRLAAARQADALFHGARAWSRADQDDRAIENYRLLVEKFPHSKPAPEASFLIGWLEFNRGRFKQALPGLAECLRRYGSSPFADDAHWYLGFSKWMLGDVSGALVEFDWLSKRSGALDGGKGRYWRGRALLRLKRKDDAIAEWRRLAADYAFSYYAQQARVRLHALGVKLDPFGRAPGEKAPAPAAGGIALDQVDESLARDEDVARADELVEAGLPREAGRALERAASALINRYGLARALPLLLDRYEKADDFFRVHRLGERYAGGALRRDPQADPAARAWWQKVYPLAYRRFIERYGPSGNNPPYYLYTIMQKESAYNPHDVSYADAIGLLQMIPPTSRRVGDRIGRPYTDDVLYDPEGNIQFGAWYIGHLLEKFKGQVAIGAGSYNAGPKAMMRWVKQNGARELDEFIELCSYTQTREYMKKALDIYAHYEWLYAGRDYLPDEKIDAKYLENEIDY